MRIDNHASEGLLILVAFEDYVRVRGLSFAMRFAAVFIYFQSIYLILDFFVVFF